MNGSKHGRLAIFLGFSPWVAFGVLTALGHRGAGFVAGLTLAGVLLALQAGKRRIKAMEVASTAFFAVQTLLTQVIGWDGLHAYDLVLLYVALAAMAWTTLALRSPFTLQYAREDWPKELWDQPIFRRTNVMLTVAWGIIFTANAFCAAVTVGAPTAPVWLYGIAIPHVGVALGVALSIVLPRVFPRWALARQLADEAGPPWVASAVPAARPEAPDQHDVIVVGAGIGGLSAAALMARRGLKVLVLDHHYLPGGFCTSWPRSVGRGGARPTYIFDAGVHDVSGLGPNGAVRWL